MQADSPEKPQAEEGLDQHYQVLKELGDCYAAVADHERARQCYRRAAELAPQAAGPYVGLGVVAMQTNRLADSVRAFRTALEKDPQCAEAYGGVAMVHQLRREYGPAFEMYLKCLELDSDNLVALLGLFQTSVQMGTFCKIIHYLQLYLDRHPGDTSVLFCLGSLYAREGKLEQARQVLQSVLALEPHKAEASSLLGEVENKLATMSPQESLRA